MQEVEQACTLLVQARQIRIIAHATADAICASAILASVLNQAQKHYSLSFFSFCTDVSIPDVRMYDCVIFLDVVPPQKFQVQKNVLILTHRAVSESKLNSASACVLAPGRLGLKYGEIATSGITHLICERFNTTSHPHLALLGAFAEGQETRAGFVGSNLKFLTEACAAHTLTQTEGLRLPGKEKPLSKVLEWCIDPYLSGLFGSEHACEAFLHQLEIHTKHEEDWRRLADLTPEEIERLYSALQALLPDYQLKGPCILYKGHDYRDLTEVLTACASLNRCYLGLGFCLEDTQSTDRALLLCSEYHRTVLDALTFARKQHISQHDYTLVPVQQQIPLTLLAKISHILSLERKNTVLCIGNDGTQVLLAVSGPDVAIIHSLCLTLKDLTLISESAALAPFAKEPELITYIEQLLRKVSMEETVH